MSPNLKTHLARIDQLKAEIDSLRPLKREQEVRIFEKFRLDWNFHSNAIEGNQLTLGETAMFLGKGLTASGKPIKDHLDLRGHDHVISFLLEFVNGREELTEALTRELHKMMLVEPYEVESVTEDGRIVKQTVPIGEYKRLPNQVTTLSGTTHKFALPDEVSPKMTELILWHRSDANKVHPVVAAAMFHYQFVAIHPFADGNGRMARILMNLILMRASFPPIIIRTTERDAYASRLAQADAGDSLPFVEFIAEKAIASLTLLLRGAKGESVEEEDDVDKRIALLKQKLNEQPEPIVYSEAVYSRFADENLLVLIPKLIAKLSKFDDLFVSTRFTVAVNDSYVNVENYPQNLSAIVKLVKKDPKPRSVKIQIQWETFKKGGAKSFNQSIEVGVSFKTLMFKITSPGYSTEKPYGEILDPPFMNSFVNQVAQTFVETIEKFCFAQPPQ